MDRELLNKYNQEEKLILSKIIDKINFCVKRNRIQITDFYDLGKQNMIEKFLRFQKQITLFYMEHMKIQKEKYSFFILIS